MKAIILAAGRGSRMKGLTDDRPKCLVEIKGITLLDRQLEAIKAAGITDIAIVSGYKRELLTNRGFVEFHNPRWAETNMVSSLACAKEWLKAGPCIVSYSDIFYASSAVSALMKSDSDIAITFDPCWLELWKNRFVDPLDDAETFRLDKDGCLAEIGNKPKTVDEIQGQYMGLLRFSPKGWGEVERICAGLSQEERDRIHMTGAIQRVIEYGQIQIEALPYLGVWGEIDSGDDLRKASLAHL